MNTDHTNSGPFTVIVGIDFSEMSDLALDRACDLAGAHPATHVHVVHAAPEPTMASGPDFQTTDATAPDVGTHPLSTSLYERVDKVVRQWCEVHDGPPTFARLTTHIRPDMAAQAIAQLASDLDANLIVVGTHGHRGARRFLLGSVAESTVRLAPCDVLVVRPPDATIPKIEPPCPRCVDSRRATNGVELWCEQHRERHGRRHTYHSSPSASSHQSGLLLPID
jgi:nucleotide-binding universal stress UspA family protein